MITAGVIQTKPDVIILWSIQRVLSVSGPSIPRFWYEKQNTCYANISPRDKISVVLDCMSKFVLFSFLLSPC